MWLAPLLLFVAVDAWPPSFPLSTSGRWIVDRDGHRVKLACVNWAGAEVEDGVVGGLHLRSAESIAKTFREMGFNCVRFPWSVWMAARRRSTPGDVHIKCIINGLCVNGCCYYYCLRIVRM